MNRTRVKVGDTVQVKMHAAAEINTGRGRLCVGLPEWVPATVIAVEFGGALYARLESGLYVNVEPGEWRL